MTRGDSGGRQASCDGERGVSSTVATFEALCRLRSRGSLAQFAAVLTASCFADPASPFESAKTATATARRGREPIPGGLKGRGAVAPRGESLLGHYPSGGPASGASGTVGRRAKRVFLSEDMLSSDRERAEGFRDVAVQVVATISDSFSSAVATLGEPFSTKARRDSDDATASSGGV